MTITEARKNLYALVDAARNPGMAVAITHNGTPKVVVMSYEEYEGWQETMEIMADPELSTALDEAVHDMQAGKLHTDTMSLEDAKKKLAL